jgi:hypothetical protein
MFALFRDLAQLRQYTTEEMNERSANGITAGITARCALCVSVSSSFGATHHLAPAPKHPRCLMHTHPLELQPYVCVYAFTFLVRKLANASMHERMVFELVAEFARQRASRCCRHGVGNTGAERALSEGS